MANLKSSEWLKGFFLDNVKNLTQLYKKVDQFYHGALMHLIKNNLHFIILCVFGSIKDRKSFVIF